MGAPTSNGLKIFFVISGEVRNPQTGQYHFVESKKYEDYPLPDEIVDFMVQVGMNRAQVSKLYQLINTSEVHVIEADFTKPEGMTLDSLKVETIQVENEAPANGVSLQKLIEVKLFEYDMFSKKPKGIFMTKAQWDYLGFELGLGPSSYKGIPIHVVPGLSEPMVGG